MHLAEKQFLGLAIKLPILDLQRVSWSEVLVAFVPILVLAVALTVPHILSVVTVTFKILVVISNYILKLSLNEDFLS